MTAESGGAAPRLVVVLLNWNGAPFTRRCLDSLLAAHPRPAGVVLVDNASRPGELEELRALVEERAASGGWRWTELVDDERLAPGVLQAAPWLVLQRLTEQRGFSGGNNAGIRTAISLVAPSHLLLLNNDTEVAPDYFAALAVALRAEPEAALLSGTIRELEDRRRVWYAGGRMIPLRALALHDLEIPADPAPRPTGFVTGCAMVVSREALRTLGPLPECYFPAYMEDAEYSWRARRAGLRVLYAPLPLVYHHGGAAAGRAVSDPWPAYLGVRHRAFFVRRNFHGPRRWLALAYLAATKPARAVLEIARGRPAMASALLRGTLAGMLSPVGDVPRDG